MNGIEFKNIIDKEPILKKKSIPFIFLSSSASGKEIEKAYDTNVQGCFFKPSEIKDLTELLKTVLNYWSKCKRPDDD